MSDEEVKQPFLFLWTSDPGRENDQPGDPTIEEWLAEGDAAGAWQLGEPVAGPGEARSVARRGTEVIVTDGPFPEFKEWFYGFDVVLAHDLDEAVAYASRHPLARAGRAYVLPTFSEDAGDSAHDGDEHDERRLTDDPSKKPFLLLWTSDPGGEPHRPDDPQFEDWVAEGQAKGVDVMGMSVVAASEARTVVRRGAEVVVTDGPFSEFTEWFYGFNVVLADGVDEAVEFASRHPAVRAGRGYVLPTVAPEDLG